MGLVKEPVLIYKQHAFPMYEQNIAEGKVVATTYSHSEQAQDNQDALALVPVSETECILILSDGAGGHPAGDWAAQTILKSVLHYSVATRRPGQVLRDCILTAIDAANDSILESKTGAGATACIALIEGHSVRPFYIGDSSILITGQRGQLVFKNTEHSPIGYVEKSTLLDTVEMAQLEQTNEVFSLVGDQSMHIEIGPSIDLKQRDTLLLCSDGISDNLTVDDMIECIRTGDLPTAANRLITLNQQRIHAGGHLDDQSFILYRRAWW